MLKNTLKRTAGYTIDQTILIVAVIAVLITLIVASVGWDLLNRTSGTKLASQIRQIEDANGQFFARQQSWPQDAVDSSTCADPATGAVAVLAGQCMTGNYANRASNLLAGLEISSNVVQHDFGSGGDISQVKSDTTSAGHQCPGGFQYLIVTFQDIPETELKEADETLDGTANASAGRLTWDDSAGGDVFDAEYCANMLGK